MNYNDFDPEFQDYLFERYGRQSLPKRRPPAAAPPPPDEGVTFGDYAKTVGAGFADLGAAAGTIADLATGGVVGSGLAGSSRGLANRLTESLTPAAKRALAQKFVSDQEGEFFGPGATNLSTIGLNVARSLPTLAPGLGAGGLAARGAARVAAARTATLPVAAQRAAIGKAAERAAIGAGGVTEGAIAGGSSASETLVQGRAHLDQLAREAPQQLYDESPYYRRLIDHGVEAAEARELTARKAASSAGLTAGVATAILGAPFQAYLGRLVGGGRQFSLPQRIVGGGLGEAGTEAIQSAQETYQQQRALRDYAAGPEIDTNQILESAVAGAITGFALGAGTAPLQGKAPEEPPPAAPPPQLGRQAPTETGDPNDFITLGDGSTLRRDEAEAIVRRANQSNDPALQAHGERIKAALLGRMGVEEFDIPTHRPDDPIELPDGSVIRRDVAEDIVRQAEQNPALREAAEQIKPLLGAPRTQPLEEIEIGDISKQREALGGLEARPLTPEEDLLYNPDNTPPSTEGIEVEEPGDVIDVGAAPLPGSVDVEDLGVEDLTPAEQARFATRQPSLPPPAEGTPPPNARETVQVTRKGEASTVSERRAHFESLLEEADRRAAAGDTEGAAAKRGEAWRYAQGGNVFEGPEPPDGGGGPPPKLLPKPEGAPQPPRETVQVSPRGEPGTISQRRTRFERLLRQARHLERKGDPKSIEAAMDKRAKAYEVGRRFGLFPEESHAKQNPEAGAGHAPGVSREGEPGHPPEGGVRVPAGGPEAAAAQEPEEIGTRHGKPFRNKGAAAAAKKRLGLSDDYTPYEKHKGQWWLRKRAKQAPEAVPREHPDVIRAPEGKPFRNKGAALSARKRLGLGEDYQPVEKHKGQWELQRLAPTKPPSSEHPDDLGYNLPKGASVGGPEEIAALFAEAQTSNKRRSIRYRVVDDAEAARLKASTGIDAKGFRHIVDTSGINHALKGHGEAEGEQLRGQEPITSEDFKRIPEIIAEPDSIEYRGKDDEGLDLIRYTKRLNGTTFYMEEVRRKRRELAAKSLWKTRTPRHAPSAEGPALTSGTSSGNPPELDTSIPGLPDVIRTLEGKPFRSKAAAHRARETMGLGSDYQLVEVGARQWEWRKTAPKKAPEPVKPAAQGAAKEMKFTVRNREHTFTPGGELPKPAAKDVGLSVNKWAWFYATDNEGVRYYSNGHVLVQDPPIAGFDAKFKDALERPHTDLRAKGTVEKPPSAERIVKEPADQPAERRGLIETEDRPAAAVYVADKKVIAIDAKYEALVRAMYPDARTFVSATPNGVYFKTPDGKFRALIMAFREDYVAEQELRRLFDKEDFERVAKPKARESESLLPPPSPAQPGMRELLAQRDKLFEEKRNAVTKKDYRRIDEKIAEVNRAIEQLEKPDTSGGIETRVEAVEPVAQLQDFVRQAEAERDRAQSVLDKARWEIAVIELNTALDGLRLDEDALKGKTPQAFYDALVKRIAVKGSLGADQRGRVERAKREKDLGKVLADSRYTSEPIAHIAESHPNEAYRALAKRILPYLGKSAFHFIDGPPKKLSGEMHRLARMVADRRRTTPGVTLTLPSGESLVAVRNLRPEETSLTLDEVVLHEGLHAATVARIAEGGLGGAHPALAKATADIEALHGVVLKEFRKRRKLLDATTVGRMQRALENPFDLVAYGLSNPTTQEFLKSVPVKQGTAWTEFVNILRRLLGLKGAESDALSELLAHFDALLKAPSTRSIESAITTSYQGKLYSRAYTPEQQAAIERGGFGVRAPVPLKERVQSGWAEFKARFRQGMVDQFHSFRKILNNERAYMLATLSHTENGVIAALLRYGRPRLDNGAVAIDTDQASLRQIFEPLGSGPELNDWLAWMVGHRAERLAAEDREQLFDAGHINALKSLNQGKLADGRDRAQVYDDVRREFEAMNNAVVDMGVATGLINADEAALWRQEGFYIPFYRMLEEGDTRGPLSLGTGKLVNMTAFHRLRGAEKAIADPLTNVLGNWNHLIGASLRNQAAKAALEAAVPLGVAEPGRGKHAVYVRENGRKVWYRVNDPLVLESLQGLNHQGLNNAAFRFLRTAKHLLTAGVTASPGFMAANMLRDSIHSVAVSDVGKNIPKNLISGFKATRRDSDTYVQMTAGGGSFTLSGYIHGADPVAIQRLLELGAERDSILTHPFLIKRALNKYFEFGARLENINRAALFEQELERGGDRLTANFKARDLLDHARTGAFPAVRALAQSVAFLNSRLQGLDKLARAYQDPAQRGRFLGVTLTYAMASVLLYLAMKDEEGIKDAEEWERDTYHLFKLPGSDKVYRFPRPFEVGAIASMAERVAEQFVDQEADGGLFADRLRHALTQTFAFNPVPQAFMPMLDVYANRDSFTGREIENLSMKNLSPARRKTAWTSQTAIALSQAYNTIAWDAIELSPAQMDHLVNGYLGWAGSLVTAGLDDLVRPFQDRGAAPSKALFEYEPMRRFVRESEGRSKYATEFYEQLREVNEIYADINDAKRSRETREAAMLYRENARKLAHRARLNKVSRQLSALRKLRDRIHDSKTLDAAAKRERLQAIQARANRIARTATRASRRQF